MIRSLSCLWYCGRRTKQKCEIGVPKNGSKKNNKYHFTAYPLFRIQDNKYSWHYNHVCMCSIYMMALSRRSQSKMLSTWPLARWSADPYSHLTCTSLILTCARLRFTADHCFHIFGGSHIFESCFELMMRTTHEASDMNFKTGTQIDK